MSRNRHALWRMCTPDSSPLAIRLRWWLLWAWDDRRAQAANTNCRRPIGFSVSHETWRAIQRDLRQNGHATITHGAATPVYDRAELE